MNVKSDGAKNLFKWSPKLVYLKLPKREDFFPCNLHA